ncbi:SMP-30/Gluconolaconase/LRE domain protein [Reticulomyxa filosa]|uniref:SMP-30/Gluconolaconase/LRE domain protein n=1 Tax=Reticulomyxa filosa TaxID=46433 RepID=X6NB19_RETFI|nr:SMP-30/Gluconolaconase/LRE domain protein [Reticulomyxa filosa]|eukprot:ETO23103.1 SMP-30/Gluconolaconase/LRE domain protein [Reticulomyxa filosa]
MSKDEFTAYLQLYRLVPLTKDIPRSYIIYGENASKKNDEYSNELSSQVSASYGHMDHAMDNFISKLKDKISISKNDPPVASGLHLQPNPVLNGTKRLSSGDTNGFLTVEPCEHNSSFSNSPQIHDRFSLLSSQSVDMRGTAITVSAEDMGDAIRELIEKALSLCNKYVTNNSPYAINVSYEQRKEVLDWLAQIKDSDVGQWTKIDVLKLVSIFDICGIEMFRLLINAFRRWKNTEQIVFLKIYLYFARVFLIFGFFSYLYRVLHKFFLTFFFSKKNDQIYFLVRKSAIVRVSFDNFAKGINKKKSKSRKLVMLIFLLLLVNEVAFAASFGDVIRIEANDLQPETAFWDDEFQTIYLGSWVNGTIYKSTNCDANDICDISPIWHDSTVLSINGFRRFEDKLYICTNVPNSVYAWLNGSTYYGADGGFMVVQIDFDQYSGGTGSNMGWMLCFFVAKKEKIKKAQNIIKKKSKGNGGLSTQSSHFCNDVQIDTNGVAYVTDSFAGCIYQVTPPTKENTNYQIQVIAYNDVWWSKKQFGANGIGLYSDKEYLIIGSSYSGQLWKLNLSHLSTNYQQNFGEQVQMENVMNLLSIDGILTVSSTELFVVGILFVLFSLKETKFATGTSLTQIGDDVYVVNAYLRQPQITENQIEKVIFPQCPNQDNQDSNSDSTDKWVEKYIFVIILGIILVALWGAIVTACVIFRRRANKPYNVFE